jgi:hypothetical protein
MKNDEFYRICRSYGMKSDIVKTFFLFATFQR